MTLLFLRVCLELFICTDDMHMSLNFERYKLRSVHVAISRTEPSGKACISDNYRSRPVSLKMTVPYTFYHMTTDILNIYA